VEGGITLVGIQTAGVDAGQHRGAVSVFQKNLAGIVEGLDFHGNGQAQQRAYLGFIQGRVEQADVLLHNLTLRINDEQRGQCGDSTVINPDLSGRNRNRIIQALVLDEAAQFLLVILIDHKPDNLKLVLIALLQRDKTGDFRSARSTPDRPEIEKNNFSPRRDQIEVIAFQVLDLKFGSRIRIAHKADHR